MQCKQMSKTDSYDAHSFGKYDSLSYVYSSSLRRKITIVDATE